ncbi:MAG: family 16 glycosylhydrolase [Planctomycetota bacterium]|nr:family 16 glycosylhydrolase [Planctomycetota bacterium]
MRRFASILSLLALCLAATHADCQVIWSDEFNGDQIDTEVWIHDVGGHGFGNGQLEFDTARRENSYLEKGNLVIAARRESYLGKPFTSARLVTQGRFAFLYGTLEARIKVPDTANGVWPAFWMLGNNFPAIPWPQSGEIDILEIGSKAGITAGLQRRQINCALHFAGAGQKKTSHVSWHDAPVDLNRDYHLYKVSWTPRHLKFFLDGNEFGSWDIRAAHLREFHQPCFPILNVAVGGWDTSYTGIARPEDVTATFPAKMLVDWIRLTKNAHTRTFFSKDHAEQGSFGVYTERASVRNGLTFESGDSPDFSYGSAATLYTWNNMQPAANTGSPSEGRKCWSFDIAAGQWFGMGVFLPNFRNMKHYSDGLLHFDIKTTSTAPMRVGIKSSRGGEFFLPLGDASDEFGFPRDGKWQTLAIPLNRFANIDFQTVHQMFMIAGDAPQAALNLSIDNVWWQPSAARPTPSQGNFGVYTESADHRDAGAFALGAEGNFYIWEKTLRQERGQPYEGLASKRLRSAPGANWFGAAFTPNVKHDLSAYRSPDAKLHFCLKTRSRTPFLVGMKSGNVDGLGQKWIPFRPGRDPYGFARDGKWHVIQIPMSEIAAEVDLSQVSQFFQILSRDGRIADLEFDDICFLAGRQAAAERD